MLDILLLRKDLDTAIARLETRKKPQAFLNVEAFQALESERKTLQTRTEELQAQRNQLSKQIGMLMGKGDKEGAEAAKAQVAASKVELEQSAARLEQIQAELQTMLVAVPNLPHESVPVGSDESGNVEVRRWGTPASFAFEVKDHVDVGTPLGLDFDMGVKLSGSRFTVMKGQIARLHRALSQFMLDVQTQEHGYTECYVPYAVNADSLKGTGQLPKFEGDLFAAEVKAFGGIDPFSTDAATPPRAALFPSSDGAYVPCQPLPAGAAYGVVEVVDLALCQNPKTHESWANARAQAAQVGVAQSAYLPDLDGKAGRSKIHTDSERTNTSSASLTLSWLLYDSGARSANLENARQLLSTAASTLDATVQNVFFSALQAYYNTQAARAAVVAAQESEKPAARA